MSAEPSSAWSTQSKSGLEPIVLPQYSFVEQAENFHASKTRRAVRSHAMKAVRRQQRQENIKTFRLRWPEEHSSGKEPQLTWPEGQSSSFGEGQKWSELEEGGKQEANVSGIPSLDSSESIINFNGYDPFAVDFQPGQISGYTIPQLERAEPAHSAETDASSQYTTAEADEVIPRVDTNVGTLLGAGRVNPFQTFPGRTDRSMSELIDHCMFSSHQLDCLPVSCSCVLTRFANLRYYHHAGNILRHRMS